MCISIEMPEWVHIINDRDSARLGEINIEIMAIDESRRFYCPEGTMQVHVDFSSKRFMEMWLDGCDSFEFINDSEEAVTGKISFFRPKPVTEDEKKMYGMSDARVKELDERVIRDGGVAGTIAHYRFGKNTDPKGMYDYKNGVYLT